MLENESVARGAGNTCNPSTWEVEIGGSRKFQRHLQLQSQFQAGLDHMPLSQTAKRGENRKEEKEFYEQMDVVRVKECGGAKDQRIHLTLTQAQP